MAKIRLASQKVNAGSSGRGLSPSLLSAPHGGISVAGAKINAPQINANAGRVQYTNMPVPGIQTDPMANALVKGGGFAGTLIDSSFRFQQREDQVIADQAVLELGAELRDIYYGTADEEGVLTGGYSTLKGTAASQGYGGFQQAVDETVQKKFENMTPSQRANAVIRFTQTRNGYLTKASQHAASELTRAEAAAADSLFNETMEQMARDVITGSAPDLGSMQTTLAKFKDPDERKKRDVQLTESLLYQTLQTKGRVAAIDTANALTVIPGVGNQEAVQNFLNFIENRDRSRAGEERAVANHKAAMESQARTETTRAANTFMTDNLTGALNADNSKGINAVVSEVTKAFGKDTGAAKEALEKGFDDALNEGWENALVKGVSGRAEFKAKVMDKIDSLPAWLQDDVRKTFDELEQKEREDNLKAIDYHNKQLADELRSDREIIDNEIETLASMGRHAEGFEELAEDVISRTAITDSQRLKIERLANGTTNPFVESDLAAIEDRWEDIVDRPELLKEYDIPAKEYSRLRERARQDRVTAGADIHKLARKELLRFYQLESSPLGGLTLSMGGKDGNISEEEAKQNYTRTVRRYDELVRGYLRVQDGKRSMSPGEASQKALGDLLSDDLIRAGMTGLPEGQPEAGKAASGQLNYQSDHRAILNTYAVPEPPKGFKGGPLNLVTYAKNIGTNVKLPDGYTPRRLMAERVAEVTELYDTLMRDATSVSDLVELQRQHTNLAVQFKYIQGLVPSAATETTETTQFARQIDADTMLTSSGTRARTTMAAAEMDTEEGQQQTEQIGKLYQATSPNNRYSVDVSPGTGYFGRPIVSPSFGGTDMDVMAKEGGIIPQTYNEFKGLE